MLLLRRPRSSQPQHAVGIDWANPLARDLKILVSNNGGSLREVVSGRLPASRGSSTRQTSKGIAEDFANTQATFAHHPNHDVLGELTIAALVYVDALSNYSAIISKNSGGTTAMPFEFRLSGGTADGSFDLLRANATYKSWNARAIATGSLINTGTYNFVSVAIDAEISSRPTYYVNGQEFLGTNSAGLTTGNGTGSGVATSNQGTLYVGKRADGVTYLDGGLLLVCVWGRKLSVAELKGFEANPWQLFAPRRIYIPTSTAAATVPTLSNLSARLITSSSAQPQIDYTF